MWCFGEFLFPFFFFFTSVWTLLGTKVEAFAPLPPTNLLLHQQLLTGRHPQTPQILTIGSPAASERAGVTTSLPRAEIEVKGKENFNKKTKKTTWTHLYNWRTLGANMHVGTDTGTVLHWDVCRWELRWQCALSKERRPCSVNGAGSGRLAINPTRIEDSNLPLTAAVTWSDLWRPANYLSK